MTNETTLNPALQFDREFVEWCDRHKILATLSGQVIWKVLWPAYKDRAQAAAENASIILNLCAHAGLSHDEVDLSKQPLDELIAAAFNGRRAQERRGQ